MLKCLRRSNRKQVINCNKRTTQIERNEETRDD